jgi:hypothetical protein
MTNMSIDAFLKMREIETAAQRDLESVEAIS